MKKYNRRIVSLICSIAVMFSNAPVSMAESLTEETEILAQESTELLSQEGLSLDTMTPETAEPILASGLKDDLGELLLARITEKETLFYYDPELTEPAFWAEKDASYIIIEEMAWDEKEVLCVEAYNGEQEIVPVYVSKDNVFIWKETAGTAETQAQEQTLPMEIEGIYEDQSVPEDITGSEETQLPDTDLESIETELPEDGMETEESTQPEAGMDDEIENDTETQETADPEEDLETEGSTEQMEQVSEETDTSVSVLSEEVLETEIAEETQTFQASLSPDGVSGNGSFYLAAWTKDALLIPPMTVYYASGDTLVSLMRQVNGHRIFMETDGSINSIDGVEAGFLSFTESGAADMSAAADNYGYLALSDREVSLSGEWQDLIRVMAEYLQDGTLRENQEAAEIYQQIVELYPTLSDKEAGEWAKKLAASMEQETIETGDTQEPQQVDGVYQISTGGELRWFADLVNGKLENREAEPGASAVLTADVSIAGELWNPMGSPEIPFTGSFRGNGHTISGLEIHSEESYQALFGYAGSTAVISDLHVSGLVECKADYAAGIVAYSEASLSNLYNSSQIISSAGYAGGVAGCVYGKGKEVTVTNCVNDGSVYSTGTYVGGIVGGGQGEASNDIHGNFFSCRNRGDVTGARYVGGISGVSIQMQDCVNEGNIHAGFTNVGGVAGISKVTGCENYGTISISGKYDSVRGYYEGYNIGGIVGYGDAINCSNYGTVMITSGTGSRIMYMAGITGNSKRTENCLNYGTIYYSGWKVGGISGFSENVVCCANFGDVLQSGKVSMEVGGISGHATNTEQCFNTGQVTGGERVGGVVGGTRANSGKADSTNTAVVEQCYNLGEVSGSTAVGGIAGLCKTASFCYDVGKVSADDTYGPIAGGFVSVVDCYYLNTLSAYGKCGTPLSREELRVAMIPAEHFRVNFSEEYHDGYPYLSFEGVQVTAHVESIVLPDGVSDRYVTLVGQDPAELPAQLIVNAGGLTFHCDASWIPEEGYDNLKEGTYIFSPQVTLQSECIVDETTRMAAVTVTVVTEDQLPLISELRLAEGTPLEYDTAYGKEPEGLPKTALAVVDGEEKEIAVTWKAQEGADLTDTETPIRYTMQTVSPMRLGDGVAIPQITVHVLPEMLIKNLHFTANKEEDSSQFQLSYRGCESVDGVQQFYYDLELLDITGYKYTINPGQEDDVWLWTELNEEMAEDTVLTCSFTRLTSGLMKSTRPVTPGSGRMLSLFAAEHAEYVGENDLLLTAVSGSGEEEIRQCYHIHSRIHPTLDTLELTSDQEKPLLNPSFDGKWTDYSAMVPAAVDEILFTMVPVLGERVSVSLDGKILEADESGAFRATVPMGEEDKTVSVVVTRTQDDGSEASTTYEIRLTRPLETKLTAEISPEGALLRISNPKTGVVSKNADGTYTLFRNYTYEYLATAPGYVMQTGSITASEEKMELSITLEAAPKNPSIITDMESDWDSFRGGSDNNAVTDALTPTDSKKALLYWANAAGSGFDSSTAVSSPILVDGYIICTTEKNIFKLDSVTGEIVAVGDMVTTSVFNITPPTYGDGMIFVALAGGVIQAFNADTLESLWVYRDPLGGQPNSPITYKNGYLYTGFWKNEVSNANLVCLSATDEKPSSALEEKTAVWTWTQKGGFYWAGACATDQFVLVGTEDGANGYTSETACLLSLDPATGAVIDCLNDVKTDVRSTICYDSKTDRYYFTTKGGYFYSVAVSPEGKIDRDSIKIMDLRDGRTGDDGTTPVEGMSTSTPVVYNGRAYVGVSGTGQFLAYNGHCIAVIDLEKWEIAYTCPTKGYPQTSGLLTTGYEDTGKVYLYFFENASPGTLRIICDSPGQTEMISVSSGEPISKAEDLFTPRGSQRQFALCSPIVDAYGTLYFKNDSGYMMALGSTIEKIEVTEMPQKTMYEAGECFDAAGMQVTATYSNGLTRDITKYVTYSEEPLTTRDTDITVYFKHVLYNNTAEVIDPPQTVVNLKVLSTRDMEALNSVIAGIAGLGEITLSSGDNIRAVRRTYDNLKDSLKEYVDNYETLTAAEETYSLLEDAELKKVKQVIRLIDAIGDVTLDSGDTIQSATELYEALTNYGKVRVTNYSTLRAAQQEYEELIRKRDAQAAEVMNKISALGEITLESGAAIVEARAAYDALGASSKEQVTNYAVLTAAEARYQELLQEREDQVEAVSSLIDAIGTVTLEKEAAIRQAREAYDRLEESAASKVTNYETLTKAEETLAGLKKQLEALTEVTKQLDAYAAQIKETASEPDKVTSDNAAAVAEQVQKIEALVKEQSSEDQSLLDSYLTMTDSYRSAVAAAVHTDAATGVTVDGLEWDQKILVEVLSSEEEDYKLLETGLSPQKAIKAYRVKAVDLISGEPVADHDTLELEYEILVPDYNESAYASIGVVSMKADGTVTPVSSMYTDNKRKIAFAVIGDGVIAVAGTKADQKAGDSQEGSGSILDGTDKPGSDDTDNDDNTGDSPIISDGTNGNGSTSGNGSSGGSGTSGSTGSGNSANANNGSVGSSGSVLGGSSRSGSSSSGSSSGTRTSASGSARSSNYISSNGTGSSALTGETGSSLYGNAVETGEWEYQKTLLPSVFSEELEDDQITLYKNLSEAVEEGTQEFVSGPVSQEAFDAVLACYRQTNPLECLVSDVKWKEEDGTAVITYQLTPEEHQTVIDEWHAQIARILDSCLVAEEEEGTAARLYQYLTTTMKPYIAAKNEQETSAEMEIDTETGADTADAAKTELETDTETETDVETTADLEELCERFAPSPFYALMKQQVSANNAAAAYEYLLMQAGIQVMPVQVKLLEEDADTQDAAEASDVTSETSGEEADEDEEGTEASDDAETETEEGTSSADKPQRSQHQWVVVKLGESWYHADPELDIAVASSAGSGSETDALAHFGMSDENCRRALQAEGEFEVVLSPELMAYCESKKELQPEEETEALGQAEETEEEASSKTEEKRWVRPAVPVCSSSLEDYSISQTVIEKKEDTADEQE